IYTRWKLRPHFASFSAEHIDGADESGTAKCPLAILMEWGSSAIRAAGVPPLCASTGEGDRREAVEGAASNLTSVAIPIEAPSNSACAAAPSTTQRVVPLPRAQAQGRIAD